MLSDKMNEALNQQINEELYSSYLYLSMAAQFEAKNLPGVTNWLKCQTQEELVHAMRLFDYINERGGRATMLPIKGPGTEWESPLAAFEAAYKHECYISGCINKLVDVAREEGDHATENFLQWFVTEQVEEEASADGVVQQLKLAGSQGPGLFMVDTELGQRVFTPPPAEGEAG